MTGDASSRKVSQSDTPYTPCSFPWLYNDNQQSIFSTSALKPWVDVYFFVEESCDSYLYPKDSHGVLEPVPYFLGFLSEIAVVKRWRSCA